MWRWESHACPALGRANGPCSGLGECDNTVNLKLLRGDNEVMLMKFNGWWEETMTSVCYSICIFYFVAHATFINPI